LALPLLLGLSLSGGCTLDLGALPFYCNKGKPRCPDGYECTCSGSGPTDKCYCHREDECPCTIPGCLAKNPSCRGSGGDTARPDTSPIKLDVGPDLPSGPDAPQGCKDGETKCVDTDNLSFCQSGIWKSITCISYCVNKGMDYALDCTYDGTLGRDDCPCGKYGEFGSLCDSARPCQSSLTCGTFSGSSVGFCTKYCSVVDSRCTGGPPGTEAYCNLTISSSSGTQNACGFICPSGISCPTGMKCDSSVSPPLCKP
jgi:hypothetical protein